MRILIVNGTDLTQIGGINTLIRRLSAILSKRGHNITVLSTNPGALKNDELIDGARAIRVRASLSEYSMDASFGMWRYLDTNLGTHINPDIVHIHAYGSLLAHEMALLFRLKRYPYVFSPHYSPSAHSLLFGAPLMRLGRPLGRLIFRGAERVVCASRFEADLLHTHLNVSSDLVTIIPNGVETIERQVTVTKKKEKHDTIRLLYVGWLIELKGIQYILQTVRELSVVRGCKVLLRIAGSGNYEPHLRTMAQTLGIEDKVEWLGDVPGSDLLRLYREADILLLLSISENFGTVVAESLSMGTPTIVTGNTALHEFVNEPGCFEVKYPPDIVELADLILELCEKPVRVGPFSNKIRTWGDVALEYERLYQTCIKGRQ
jgi:glycosyltransferase involved in cell wall biosynthesis